MIIRHRNYWSYDEWSSNRMTNLWRFMIIIIFFENMVI